MDILHLVDRLEELFNESRSIPFTHSVIIDEDRMLDIIDQMKTSIVQAAQARAEQILAQAQAEAENTRQQADEYVINSLMALEGELDRTLTQVRNGIRKVQTDIVEKYPSQPSRE